MVQHPTKPKSLNSGAKTHCPQFLIREEWPPSFPDLNVLNFCAWSVSEKEVCVTSTTSVDDLKKRLVKAWEKLT